MLIINFVENEIECGEIVTMDNELLNEVVEEIEDNRKEEIRGKIFHPSRIYQVSMK